MAVCLCLTPATAAVDGNPFVVNFTSDDYNGHNRNFDIIADDHGNVYIANFEGLLCYDGTTFQMLHTPGISRLTRLYRDSDGRIWFGGYNVFGRIDADAQGRLSLNTILPENAKTKIGEVTSIESRGKNIVVGTLSGTDYLWNGKELSALLGKKNTTKEPSQQATIDGHKVNATLTLPGGERMDATSGGGLICSATNGTRQFTLNHENGLCSDNVNQLSYDGNGRVWGATDNGIFCVAYPSAFSHFTENEGISGEVLCMEGFKGTLYVGTSKGLYVNRGQRFVQVDGLNGSCWQLVATNDLLYAATSQGLKRTSGTSLEQLTEQHTLSVLPLPDGSCIVGELKGLYKRGKDGKMEKLADLENVTKMFLYSDGTIFVQDVYGNIYQMLEGSGTFESIDKRSSIADGAVVNMFLGNDLIDIISDKVIYTWQKGKHVYLPVDTLDSRFDYPRFIYTDRMGNVWMTDNAGRNITSFYKREIRKDFSPWLQTIDNEQVTAMYTAGDNVFFGNKSGIICWNRKAKDPAFEVKPEVFIRSIILGTDSTLKGEYATGDILANRAAMGELSLDSHHRTILFHFSTSKHPLIGDVAYRYRKSSDEAWSNWTTDTHADFVNLSPGSYTFEVQARDCYGRLSDSATVKFSIDNPWYLRWWSILLYIALLAAIVYAILRWRTKRLLKETERLEGIVEERTSELRLQKEAVEEKSQSLEKALSELEQAQNSLVRQERMATVGKLTKGLIDRILNPINYINNFSHLSEGLANDLADDVEDDKEHMTPDIYDDMLDLTQMIKSNLSKIVEHGTNTSRILKAMEEMLKERVGKLTPTDIADICRQDMEMLKKYYDEDIRQMNIQTQIEGCSEPIQIMADGAKLSKCLLSMLANSVYAVKKKYARQAYEPVIKLSLSQQDDNVVIRIYDNGIGIEDTIKEEIFAPFFTTKTTSEASGVGLYLTKETVQAHDGDVTMESVKDQYTEFTVTLKKNPNSQTS